MADRPVHRYMSLVQCPVCRYRYMEEGEETCWECAPEAQEGATPEEIAAQRERLSAAVRALHDARITAEEDAGALGSMAGMGFAPVGDADAPRLPWFGPPEERHAPTYAADTRALSAEDLETRYAEPKEPPAAPEARLSQLFEALRAGNALAIAGVAVLVLLLLAIALVALLAAAAVGASLWLALRLARALREK